jgi:phenylacetate-coenzyme A ligase PaaK-like adenylate-forming protein
MFDLKDIIDIPPFSLNLREKTDLYIKSLSELTKHHYEKCPQYNKILGVLGFDISSIKAVEDIPFIPVRLFKEYELLSVERAKVIKTMTSSGTTGQSVSRIYLDKATSTNQTKVLTKIVSSFTGPQRLPMLVIDTNAVIKDRNLFSARGAGIIGFSMLGHDVTYALDEKMQIDLGKIQTFIDKHKDQQILLFGFTFMIWQHFYTALKAAGIRLSLDKGIIIHGGGWKKMMEQAVDNETFKKSISDVCGVARIYNYYGMVEQTGSIFMECEAGHLHASIFSDVLIRDHRDFSSLPAGKEGLVQLLSLLPLSYPGHSILSEDVGEILGEDDCPCGRKGKYFKIYGRIKNTEVRGCSDTYASGS